MSVRWSVGPSVHWSVGPLVSRSVGRSVGLSVGPSGTLSLGGQKRRRRTTYAVYPALFSKSSLKAGLKVTK